MMLEACRIKSVAIGTLPLPVCLSAVLFAARRISSVAGEFAVRSYDRPLASRPGCADQQRGGQP